MIFKGQVQTRHAATQKTNTHKKEKTSKWNKGKKRKIYSRLPISWTFKGNPIKFELSGISEVQVIGSLKQITGSKEISKWKVKGHWIWTGVNKKERQRIYSVEINSMFRTSVHGFFPTCHALILLITWFELSSLKLYRNELKGCRRETKITSS